MSKPQYKKAMAAYRKLSMNERAIFKGQMEMLDQQAKTAETMRELIETEGFDIIPNAPSIWGITDRRLQLWAQSLWDAVSDLLGLHREADEAGKALDDLLDGFDLIVAQGGTKRIVEDLLTYAYITTQSRRLDHLRAEMLARLSILDSAIKKHAGKYDQIVRPEIVERVQKRHDALQELINLLPHDLTVLDTWTSNDFRVFDDVIAHMKALVADNNQVRAVTQVALLRGNPQGKPSGDLHPVTLYAIEALAEILRQRGIGKRRLAYGESISIRQDAQKFLENLHTTSPDERQAAQSAAALLKSIKPDYLSKLISKAQKLPDLKSGNELDSHGV
jgi:hypothetical protein